MIDISLALPFTLGLVTAVNPCGFAMLPTWLGYFMGNDTVDRDARPEQIWRAFTVSLTMASGFVLVFAGRDLLNQRRSSCPKNPLDNRADGRVVHPLRLGSPFWKTNKDPLFAA